MCRAAFWRRLMLSVEHSEIWGGRGDELGELRSELLCKWLRRSKYYAEAGAGVVPRFAGFVR